ncbi:MAG: Lipoprotein signal peptidase [Oscillospiraceae bacterium]|nr:Lipoprotein signal peptidase [Oscillospiraceae bacterium]
MPYALLSAVLIAADQLVKYLVRIRIPLGGHIGFLPGVMELTYLQNTGAAFSIFREHTWALTLLSLVATAALAVVLLKKLWIKDPFGRVCLALILAGAAGNLIDRALFGWVTDMFATLFVNFAVFNVADICLTVGCVLMVVNVLLFSEKREKKEKPQ